MPVKAGVALADLVSLLKVQPTAAPVPGTAFIGRDTELDQLFHVLEANRLVTVLGPPGVGKTRLAGQLARGQTQRRVLWLDLTEHEPDAAELERQRSESELWVKKPKISLLVITQLSE